MSRQTRLAWDTFDVSHKRSFFEYIHSKPRLTRWRCRELNPDPGKHFYKHVVRDRIFFTHVGVGKYTNLPQQPISKLSDPRPIRNDGSHSPAG